MLDNWMKVYTGDEEYQAKLIVALLKNFGLSPVLLDRKDDGFRVGVVEVYVAPEECSTALRIIKENRQ